MIQANELRMGNWYLVNATGLTDESYAQFTDFQFASDYQYNCSPIPLTPEILEKCGFENIDARYGQAEIKYQMSDIFKPTIIRVRWNIATLSKGGHYVFIGTEFMPVSVKYLHQLQNLYFALTGQELNYKQ